MSAAAKSQHQNTLTHTHAYAHTHIRISVSVVVPHLCFVSCRPIARYTHIYEYLQILPKLIKSLKLVGLSPDIDSYCPVCVCVDPIHHGVFLARVNRTRNTPWCRRNAKRKLVAPIPDYPSKHIAHYLTAPIRNARIKVRQKKKKKRKEKNLLLSGLQF